MRYYKKIDTDDITPINPIKIITNIYPIKGFGKNVAGDKGKVFIKRKENRVYFFDKKSFIQNNRKFA